MELFRRCCIFLFQLCVFSVWVPCCEVRSVFRMRRFVSSSLSPVVCRRGIHVLFIIYLCLLAYSGIQQILCCVVVFVFVSSCVPNVARFFGFSFFLIVHSVFSILSQERCEDIKHIIRSRISVKNRQYNSISDKIEDRNNAFDWYCIFSS